MHSKPYLTQSLISYMWDMYLQKAYEGVELNTKSRRRGAKLGKLLVTKPKKKKLRKVIN